MESASLFTLPLSTMVSPLPVTLIGEPAVSLIDLVKLSQAGKREAAHDLFDAHLPLLRYEQQPGVGLAVRKYLLMRRGLLGSAALRKPAPAFNATTRAEVEHLLGRLARRDDRARV